MDIVIGVDIGGSTTKIVAVNDRAVIDMTQEKAASPGASLHSAVERFLRGQKLKPSDVAAVYLTGVGSSSIVEEVLGIEAIKVSEFFAIGTGALRLSGLSEALVVSMGTGTAFVRATTEEIVHIGGTGVGGGTILGLLSHLPCSGDINAILGLAEDGDLSNVDILVGDIANEEIATLPADITASNFGKLKSPASDSDFALGVINMSFEVIGVMALLALKNDSIDNVVLTGTLATFPQAKPVFDKVARLADKNFIIPPEAAFATALGALPDSASPPWPGAFPHPADSTCRPL